jgi:hypothetical protein
MNFRKLFSFFKRIQGDILIIIGCIGIFIPFLFFSKPVRVGDGSEYYALSLAWRYTSKPFMTDSSWLEYERLVDSGGITGLMYLNRLKKSMPALSSGVRSDFIHFWFYSFCAAVISKLGVIVGIKFSIHNAFLLFHCLLLAGMLVIAWRCYGWKGLVAAIILTFLSPMLWFINKVHTEFFTFCLTTIAVIFFLKRRYFPSALFLALAATQNISFSAISLFVLGVGIISQRKEKYSTSKVALIILTIAVLALQPVYYYLRYGIFSALVSSGGAKVGHYLRYAYIWFIDPDVGLFPSWPLGMVILVLSLFVLRERKQPRSRVYSWLAFVIVYIGISLWAQSSTTNLNAGATPGLARYSLWYLALFFPAISLILHRIHFSKWVSILSTGILSIGIILNFHYNNPSFDESYLTPSPFSMFIQTYLPDIYNPPPEIFAERYSGLGESESIWDSIAVFGPDCRKFLFINPATLDKKQAILGGKGCGFDNEKLEKVLEQKNHLIQNTKLVYESLSDKESKESVYSPHLAEWFSAAMDGKAVGMMVSGWSTPENWGTWSDGKRATVKIPCPSIESPAKVPLSVKFEMLPFVTPAHPHVSFFINIGKIQVWSGTLDGVEIIKVNLPTNTCVLNDNFLLNISIKNPISPASLGHSVDRRELGVALLRIRFDSANPE